jgi:hypothetical protein
MRSILTLLCFTSMSIPIFSAPRPQPQTISGRVVAYSVLPACLNGNGYWSVVIRVEQPKNQRSQLIRVDFSLPCGKSPEWASADSSVKSFRLVRKKDADVVFSGSVAGEKQKDHIFPVWNRPKGAEHNALPFGQVLPSYRSIDLPLEPVV